MTTAIVGSVIATKYLNGGNAWAVASWVLGLRRLGFEVCFVEQIERASCINARGEPVPFEESVNLAYFRSVTEAFGLAGASALIYAGGEQIAGMSRPELGDRAAAADLLINISGHLTLPWLKDPPRCKVYLDFDPGFTQFWQASGAAGARLDGHDLYFTLGENIGQPDCGIPTVGLDWQPARQPVVLDDWPVAATAEPDRFTTVATWRGPYGAVEYDGRTYGLKVHEFRKVLDLPARAEQRFELALDIHPNEQADLQRLRDGGWRLVDPRAVAADPAHFRAYVQGSGAEFSVAQGVYAATESGWFSDRTVRYLASGKPALVQDTGFSRNYPVGAGLLPFRTIEQAVAGAELIARDYAGQARAARALAEAYFDSDQVLGDFAERVGVFP